MTSWNCLRILLCVLILGCSAPTLFAQADEEPKADSQEEILQESKKLCAILLEKAKKGVPVPVGDAFRRVADPQMQAKMEEAFLPLLQSDNPIAQREAAKSLVRLLRGNQAKLDQLRPQVIEIVMAFYEESQYSRYPYNLHQLLIDLNSMDEVLASLGKRLESEEFTKQIAAASVLVTITRNDTANRERITPNVVATLNSLLDQRISDNQASQMAKVLEPLGPAAVEAVPALKRQMHRVDQWAKPGIAAVILEIQPDDPEAVQILIYAIANKTINAEYAGNSLAERVSAKVAKAAIEEALAEGDLLEDQEKALNEAIKKIDKQEGTFGRSRKLPF